MRTVDEVTDERGRVLIPSPPPARFVFQHTQAGWLWLVVRLWVGWQWLEAGWRKLTNPAWMDGSGRAIRGFWEQALGTTPEGQPVITFDWYRDFIQLLVDGHAEGWFAKVIVLGELAVALGLILGAFTGVAAAGGLLMSESYMLAGTTATSPLLALPNSGAGWPSIAACCGTARAVARSRGSHAMRALRSNDLRRMSVAGDRR